MPFHVGPLELAILLVIVVIVLGVGKLPQAGGAIGKAIKEFRQAQEGEETSEPAAFVDSVAGKKVRD